MYQTIFSVKFLFLTPAVTRSSYLWVNAMDCDISIEICGFLEISNGSFTHWPGRTSKNRHCRSKKKKKDSQFKNAPISFRPLSFRIELFWNIISNRCWKFQCFFVGDLKNLLHSSAEQVAFLWQRIAVKWNKNGEWSQISWSSLCS